MSSLPSGARRLDLMLGFPAATLLRFFHNHGFLGLHTQHPWLTVTGEPGPTVVENGGALARPPAPARRGRAGGLQLHRHQDCHPVLGATHACDRAHLSPAMRTRRCGCWPAPTADEARLLSKFRYQPNLATLHTDASVMPRTRMAWASWNTEIARDAHSRAESRSRHPLLDEFAAGGLRADENYFVSINRAGAIDPAKVLGGRWPMNIPLFSLEAAIHAQAELPRLNQAARGRTETYFAGSYFRYGFHEDALQSASRLSELLLGRDPWAPELPG